MGAIRSIAGVAYLKNFLSPGAQIVQARFAIRSANEAVLWAFAPAVSEKSAFATILW
jgi:hypothetical protein